LEYAILVGRPQPAEGVSVADHIVADLEITDEPAHDLFDRRGQLSSVYLQTSVCLEIVPQKWIFLYLRLDQVHDLAPNGAPLNCARRTVFPLG
jgi:hypothetical protein